MATASKSSHITKVSQLDKDNFELIFQEYFKDNTIKVESVDGGQGIGANMNFGSDITKFAIKLSNQEKPIKVIAKESKNGMLYKAITRAAKPFMREAFWYKEAISGLSQKYPEILELSPKCYYAYTAFGEDYAQAKPNGGFLKMALFGKTDNGLLVLEDVFDEERPRGPLHHWDKTKIVTIDAAKVALKAIATYHGIWLSWLRNQDPKTLNNVTSDNFQEVFAMIQLGKSGMKGMFNVLKAMEMQMGVLGKPNEMVEAIKIFRKEKTYDIIKKSLYDISLDKCKIATVHHGDFWSNNFFLNQENSKAYLIDLQNIGIGHPGKDFWYYLYATTDSAWRKDHLEECFQVYFEVFNVYLKQAKIDIDFEEFKNLINEQRAYGFILGTSVVTIIMHPEAIDPLSSISKYRKFMKDRQVQYSRPQTEDDHENFREVNRRLVDMTEEAYQLGIF